MPERSNVVAVELAEPSIVTLFVLTVSRSRRGTLYSTGSPRVTLRFFVSVVTLAESFAPVGTDQPPVVGRIAIAPTPCTTFVAPSTVAMTTAVPGPRGVSRKLQNPPGCDR